MKTILVNCILILTVAATAYCGQRSKVYLFDGSIVEGEVVSFLNGTYTINTGPGGTVQIGASKIRKMEAVTPALPPAPNPAAISNDTMKSQVDKVSSQIASDPQISSQVAALASDPAIQEIANDPALAAAIKAGDYQALLNNPKFMELMKNQKIKTISEKVKEQNPR